MMNVTEYLDKVVSVKIDRPMGSKLPNYDLYYPVNYGYVPNTVSNDGEELDCFILGVYEPLKEFTGKCIAIVHRTNDDDDKLILAPEGTNYTNEQIRTLTNFIERFFESEIIRPKGYIEFSKNIPELSVSNLESSLKFYKAARFKVEYERKENKFVFLSFGTIQFMLQEISDNDKWEVGELTYPFGNGINFQIEVDNVQEVYDSIKNAGFDITFEMEENWYRQDDKLLGNKEFLVQDPDGYLLRFSEDLGENK